jgi:hypothetical protein
MIDLYVLYTFVRRLTLPFNKWKAFETGVIDDEGNFIVRKEDRTQEQRNSITMMDVLILNLKKLLAKLPFGSSRIGTFAAALYLIREGQFKTNEEIESDISRLDTIMESYLTEATFLIEEGEGGVPANNIGSGKVAAKSDKKTILFRKLARKKLTK